MCGFYKNIPRAPHLWLPPRWSVWSACVFEGRLAVVGSCAPDFLGDGSRPACRRPSTRGSASEHGAASPARSGAESPGAFSLRRTGPVPSPPGRRPSSPAPLTECVGRHPSGRGDDASRERLLAKVSGGPDLDRYTARSSSPCLDHPGSALTLLSDPARLYRPNGLCRAEPPGWCVSHVPACS